MSFIGINWDHPSGASLLEGNKIKAGVCEERFSRKKNDMAFPANSIRYCMQCLDNPKKIEAVGVASYEVSIFGMLYHYATMEIANHIREQHEVWYPRIYEGKEVDDALVFNDIWDTSQYPETYWSTYNASKRETYAADSLKIIADFIGIEQSKVKRIEHHLCHAYYGYFASPYRNESAVVVTIDGFGDGLNATISVAENGRLKRIYATDKCVLGRIYRHITLLLGMKPLEHEFKVMGLAPYAKKKHSQKAFEVFSQILALDGIEFRWKRKPKDSYFHFQRELEGLRFDNIAAGLQWWLEDILCQWITNIIRETKIDTIVISGGVSMNIKAMGEVAKLPEVKRFFVPGSGSDDSNCIGAAIGAKIERNEGKIEKSVIIPSLYLGPDVSDGLCDVIRSAETKQEYIVYKNPINKQICEFLIKGLVIGRCVGRMEFGQRALGNRSLFADPINPDIIAKINSMIKNRDFWMPFAPVILDKYVDRYIKNSKHIKSPHMTVGFETTEEGYFCMKAACHPADKTARPQILCRDDNPDVYALIECFADMTGRGALLNTSFNLHGYPIVTTAAEAYEIFESTELEGLLLPNVLIMKKGKII